MQHELRRGNSYEVNLTYREARGHRADPVAAYLRLRALNPAPYSGYLQHHGVHLLSSSPERYATVDRHRRLEARPIKGTTPRADDPAADEAERARLAGDPKFRAENLMIVDLLRNDLGMVCEPGSVTVPELMAVESYRSVHQLVSTVRGRLRPEVGTVEALRALFPAGSMTGAPKLRTMQIIDAVEDTPARGLRRRLRLGQRRRPRRPRCRDPFPGRHPVSGRVALRVGHRRRHHGPLGPRGGVRRDALEGGSAAVRGRRLTGGRPSTDTAAATHPFARSSLREARPIHGRGGAVGRPSPGRVQRQRAPRGGRSVGVALEGGGELLGLAVSDDRQGHLVAGPVAADGGDQRLDPGDRVVVDAHHDVAAAAGRPRRRRSRR